MAKAHRFVLFYSHIRQGRTASGKVEESFGSRDIVRICPRRVLLARRCTKTLFMFAYLGGIVADVEDGENIGDRHSAIKRARYQPPERPSLTPKPTSHFDKPVLDSLATIL